jgi:signal transduction histidine kinase
VLQQIKVLQPDLVLMDIVLDGDMDGIETTRLIHEDCDIPVIYITADVDEPTLERARATGPFGILLKPVALPTLRSAIETAFHTRQSILQLKAQLSTSIAANERLSTIAHENAKRLQSLSHQLINIQETERRYIARELHDEIGQALTATNMILQGAQSLTDISLIQTRLTNSLAILSMALQQVRKISLDLHPSLLDDLGLVPALRWYADREASWSEFQVHVQAKEEMNNLPEELKLVCFRVVQEALTNISRHAQAQYVTIQLWESEGNIHLTVYDNGQGFDVQEALNGAAQGRSLGLLGMKERVRLVGGELEIASARHSGTKIHAQFYVGE